ncbi:hypothetical protein Q3G72_027163 [Acer saccharum]|nr:hypothetical protein Q3G72_027163 [Acer saccharum]
MGANTELTAFWAPFLLLHLGGPDTITAYALEDNELWLRHFLGLIVQTGMAIYVFLMFVAGLIKYGERTWVLRKASIETIRESSIANFDDTQSDNGINFSVPSQTNFGYDECTLIDAYRLVRSYFRALFLNVKLPSRVGSASIPSTAVEDIFKIIEKALGFMYDNLYTKAPLLYTRWGLGLRVITFFLTSSSLVLFPVVVIHDKHKFSNTDVTITYILLAGAIILELYSAVLILSSDLFLVWLIERRKYSTKKALKCFLKEKRWSTNMSQFSLISFIIKEKPLPCLNFLKHLSLDKSLTKQWYAVDMKIPNNLKKLICLYLQEKSKGRNGPTDDSVPMDPVGLNFTEELEKSFLAWHVTTDIRYELDGEEIKQLGHDFKLHCGWICQISRYMFYLLVRHPDMISEGSMNQIKLQSILLACRSILWAARSRQFTSKIEACNFLEELLTVSETYLDQQHLVLQGDDDNDIKIFFKDRLPGLVIKLSKQMSLEERWKIISWTWLEMLPYAAIKCGGIQHAQQLKNGGEFLTHIWFLVTVLFQFTHKDFTSDPSADPRLFNSVMPLLNRFFQASLDSNDHEVVLTEPLQPSLNPLEELCGLFLRQMEANYIKIPTTSSFESNNQPSIH